MVTHATAGGVPGDGTASVGIVGGGPAALVLAVALARRGIPSTVFERDPHPEDAPRFHPDRSYTIDTSGHGLRALRHIDATRYLDERVNPFRGIKVLGRFTEEWTEPGWTGSRGDYLRALTALIADRHGRQITVHYEVGVTAVDVRNGIVRAQPRSGPPADHQFDLVVGGDGAGSVVRRALEQDCPGFSVARKSFPMYCTMVELDRVRDELHRHYLHMFSIRPFVVAGAIRGEAGPDSARWFGAVCTKRPLGFASPAEATEYFRSRCPRVLELASPQAVAAFAGRQSHHIGRTLTCSQLYGGRAVLLGDAAAPFPPIGQGLNAALESAMVLDQCVCESGHSPDQLLAAARLYDARWKPEADAVAWVAERHLAENRFHAFRTRLTYRLFGLSVVGESRRSDLSYAEAKRKAQRLWPLW